MISGYTMIRNAIKGDYCLHECIDSLLPICDEVVVSNASSDDGTTEMLAEWMAREAKLRVVTEPWTQPVRDIHWWTGWINRTRAQLNGSFQVQLDADEVLDERAYPAVLAASKAGHALWFERINYERNCRTVIPLGQTCGNLVVRCGPAHLWMPSDEPYESHAAEPEIRKVALFREPLPLIHHFGFLRRNAAMFEKSRVNLTGFFGQLDERLVKAEQEGRHWLHYVDRQAAYMTYNGPVPEHCKRWLEERGAL